MTEHIERVIANALEEKGTRSGYLRYCVLGAGHGGLCLAGHLGYLGHPVSLYNRTESQLNGVQWQGGVRLTGAVDGFGPVSLATSDMGKAMEGADVIMIVTPSTAHAGLALQMAPHLEAGQLVVLNPGRTGGALEVHHILRTQAASVPVVVAEAQTFLYASRAVSRTEGHIYKIKNSVPLATLPACWIAPALDILNRTLPCFVAGNNILSTSLENIGAIFHPALTLMNAGWIEATGGDFEYYIQGISPAVATLLESIDQERMAIARALGLQSVSAREWLYRSYNSAGNNLYEAIRNTDAYIGIKAPPSIQHRYIWEDVPMSLVPMSSLGRMLGVKTTSIDMIIDLAGIMHACDYRKTGRDVARMGISGMTVKELQQYVVGVFNQIKREGTL